MSLSYYVFDEWPIGHVPTKFGLNKNKYKIRFGCAIMQNVIEPLLIHDVAICSWIIKRERSVYRFLESLSE